MVRGRFEMHIAFFKKSPKKESNLTEIGKLFIKLMQNFLNLFQKSTKMYTSRVPTGSTESAIEETLTTQIEYELGRRC